MGLIQSLVEPVRGLVGSSVEFVEFILSLVDVGGIQVEFIHKPQYDLQQPPNSKLTPSILYKAQEFCFIRATFFVK